MHEWANRVIGLACTNTQLQQELSGMHVNMQYKMVCMAAAARRQEAAASVRQSKERERLQQLQDEEARAQERVQQLQDEEGRVQERLQQLRQEALGVLEQRSQRVRVAAALCVISIVGCIFFLFVSCLGNL